MSTKANICRIKSIGITLMILLVTAMSFFSACTKKDTEEVKHLIGVAHADLSEDWQLALEQEIANHVQSNHLVELISTNANGSTFKQMKDLQTLIDYGVDLIIVTPNDNIVMKREITKVHEQVPIIVMNREISGTGYNMFIGPDFHDIGQMMGQAVVEYASNKGDEKGMNVIELKGPFNDMSVDGMTTGFHEVVGSEENVKLYAEFAADWKKKMMPWIGIYHKSLGIQVGMWLFHIINPWPTALGMPNY